MITLFIDTTNNKKTIIELQSDKKVWKKVFEVETPRSDIALELIEQTIEEAKISLSDITHIQVKKGPGSYTGIRVGVSIANALSFALGIPVNSKKLGELEEAAY